MKILFNKLGKKKNLLILSTI